MIDLETISSCPLLLKETIPRKLRYSPETGRFFIYYHGLYRNPILIFKR